MSELNNATSFAIQDRDYLSLRNIDRPTKLILYLKLRLDRMTIVRWQPLREMATMQRDLDRLFAGGDTAAISFVPAAELKADNDNIYLHLEVPGLTPEEIDVQVSANSVAITGERKEDTTAENGTKRSEFRYGKFHRVIALPKKIQQDAVQAKYENGVLKLTLPKLENEKPKTVKVEVAA